MLTRSFRFTLPVLVALCLLHGIECFGQPMTMSPYAPLELTRVTWPPFYKPDPSDAKYSKLMSGGWCQLSGKRARLYYQSKLLDVNTLPTSTLHGKVVHLQADAITVVDEKNPTQTILLVVHEDPRISLVRVHGKAEREAIQIGGFVHFIGSVDEAGVARDAIDRIELISPQRNEPIISNRLQNLSGKIVQMHGRQLTILSAAEKIRRLTIDLGAEAIIEVDLHDLRHVSIGDAVAVEGRIYRDPIGEQTIFFAEELDVTLANPLRLKPTSHTSVANAAK